MTDRKQRVKINNDCFSKWGDVTAGVPQGTKVGPWLYLIMINDLSVSNSVLWKYVDDITLSESVNKNGNSTLQLKVDELTEKTKADGFQLNETKCKEVRITLCRAGFTANPIIINGKAIDVVASAKLLGLIVSNDLKSNLHVESVCKKLQLDYIFSHDSSVPNYQVRTHYFLFDVYPPSRRVR